jgi:Family of unknown function (DUF6134)
MIGRRSFIIAGAALACARGAKAGLPVPPDARLAFRIMRHGSCIGSHTLDFRPNGNGLEVEIAVDVRVSFGPIPLVHYSHRAREIWLDDRLVGVSSHTDRNGRQLQMEAVWAGSALSVTGSGTRPYVAPHDAYATTYWRKASLFEPLIGTQDGTLNYPKIAGAGSDPIRLASGAQTKAQHYVLSGDMDVELWYDETDAWVGMRFNADDGSTISYERA